MKILFTLLDKLLKLCNSSLRIYFYRFSETKDSRSFEIIIFEKKE